MSETHESAGGRAGTGKRALREMELLPSPAEMEAREGFCDLESTGVREEVGCDGFQPEGSEIVVGVEGILLRGADESGLRHARRTLAQIRGQARYAGCGVIRDWPKYEWRGMHLDVSRYFFPPAVIRRFLDTLAALKFNVLHWHLTDDQGWRVEIKSWPRLTAVGGIRAGTEVRGSKGTLDDGIPHGGFYTQAELRGLVAYAAALGIEIVPEIDMPGHMVAAVAAYPALSCAGAQVGVRRMWGISKELLCAGKPSTMTFVEDVLAEVAEIFPSKYLHIGGDECPTDAWQACPHCLERAAKLGGVDRLHAAFLADATGIAEKLGKRVVAWDEVIEHGGPENIVGMVWRDLKYAEAAGKTGREVILCPHDWLYFDYAQVRGDTQARRPNRPTTLEKTYSFDPEAAVPAGVSVPGMQACLWTEFIPSEERLFEMMLPRAIAVAERAWRGSQALPWERFEPAALRLANTLLASRPPAPSP